MSLFKIPILLPTTWLFNISFMSPSTPPDESERTHNGAFHERVCPATFPVLHRISASIPCIAESIVILAAHYPSTLSSAILSRLVLSGDLPTPHLNRYFLLGSALATIGSLGRLWCFRALGRHFTHHLALRKDHALITTGPYAFVRHPGYLFGQLSTLGMSLVIASPGSFARRCGWLDTACGRAVIGVWAVQNVLACVLSFVRCRSEDALLSAHFGDKWEGYARRVRYWMLPGVC